MEILEVFRLRHQVCKDRADTGLERCRLGKVVQVGGEIQLSLLVDLVQLLIVLDPRVVQHLFDGGSGAGGLLKSDLNELNGLI